MSYHGLAAYPAGSAAVPCSFLQSIFGGYYIGDTWVTCAQAAANVGSVLPNTGPGQAPTLPPQAPVSGLSTNPTPPTGYTAVPMGTDSSGNQEYAYLPDAQTQAAINAQSITSQFGNIFAGPDSGSTDCSWYDTPGFINNLFNPNCGTPWGLIGLAVIAVVGAVGGLRR